MITVARVRGSLKNFKHGRKVNKLTFKKYYICSYYICVYVCVSYLTFVLVQNYFPCVGISFPPLGEKDHAYLNVPHQLITPPLTTANGASGSSNIGGRSPHAGERPHLRPPSEIHTGPSIFSTSSKVAVLKGCYLICHKSDISNHGTTPP